MVLLNFAIDIILILITILSGGYFYRKFTDIKYVSKLIGCLTIIGTVYLIFDLSRDLYSLFNRDWWLGYNFTSEDAFSQPVSSDVYPDLSEFREPDCYKCPIMTVVPSGQFWMGSPPDEPGRDRDESPQRKVSISKFALSNTEITFDHWQSCVDDGFCISNRQPDDEGWGQGSRPVINVSWHDIENEKGFIEWVNSKTEGEPYRLPSEAEWEYAVRAERDGIRNTPPFFFGPHLSEEQAFYQTVDSNTILNSMVVPGLILFKLKYSSIKVDQMPEAQNSWGFRHMHGNVWEWTQDCWHGSYNGAPVTGRARMRENGGDCSYAVMRGGSWNNDQKFLRSGNREKSKRRLRSRVVGFRLARTLPE